MEEFPVKFTLLMMEGNYPWSRGWNNQLVSYCPKTNSWEWPKTKGDRPCPRAAHKADISGDTVYLFGGRCENTRLDDLHCLHMKTMIWSGRSEPIIFYFLKHFPYNNQSQVGKISIFSE